MTPEDILALPSMPPGNPIHPAGPYRFVNRAIGTFQYRQQQHRRWPHIVRLPQMER